MDTVVDRQSVEVLRVRADMNGGGPKAAFDVLEAKLHSLRGRRFYGCIWVREDQDDYFACVERLPTEDPEQLGLEVATIPGGKYVRRKVFDWLKVVEAGRMKEIGQEFAHGYTLDPRRPTLEYYRSMDELHILLPLAEGSAATTK